MNIGDVKRIILNEDLGQFNTHHSDPYYFGKTKDIISQFLEEANSITIKERTYLYKSERGQCLAIVLLPTIIIPLIILGYHKIKTKKMKKSLKIKMNQLCEKYTNIFSSNGFSVRASFYRPTKQNTNPLYYFEISKGNKL
jgi:hypothetical protein